MLNKSFVVGVVAGVALTYVYHRFVGIPSNAPAKKA